MLEQISWKEFLVAIGGATAAYYGILVVAGKLNINRKKAVTDSTVYTNDKFTTPADSPIRDNQVKEEPSQAIVENQDEDPESEFSLLEQLADELQVIITQCASGPGSKEDLIEQMAKEISIYTQLNKPAFRRAINSLIIKVTKEESGFEITEEEANQCWPLLPYASQK
ncbi:hypothetical protein [Niabella beijingensis]|uniref:hypothetical protein n=1 Tax=Niabella beijingensis TaxID=2872700 RepID=UPI001CBBC1FB|nr:hypothetical protein [Niabella beijingensis]MBZ4188945.1 hypothetical protein [Niabella beijingensis]